MRPATTHRPWLQQCCYHLRHRCYRGCGLLKFATGRDRFTERLRQMRAQYPVQILNYLLTPTGYRLLLAAPAPREVSAALQFLHSVTAQDFCARKGWEGPVWRGHYNVTMVERGAAALRCCLDMDFTMLREQPDQIMHPLLWKHSGHLELAEARKRFRLIDRRAVRHWLLDVPWREFREWYIQASTDKWNAKEYAAEDWWEEALLVGSKSFCELVATATIPRTHCSLQVYPALASVPVLKHYLAWTIITSRTYKRRYILASSPARRSPEAQA